MKTILRLAFVVPALLVVSPAVAAPMDKAPVSDPKAEQMHYVTLDKMIHAFAEKAHAERKVETQTIVAQR